MSRLNDVLAKVTVEPRRLVLVGVFGVVLGWGAHRVACVALPDVPAQADAGEHDAGAD